MSAGAPSAVLQLISAVRQLVHDLGVVAGTPLGLTAAMRAVLQQVEQGGALTVPDIARARGVSRQHIQRLVDEMLARHLVGLEDNPAHLRSPRVVLTAQGSRLARAIAEREESLAARLARGMSASDTAAALRVLGTLKGNVAALLPARPGTHPGGKKQ